MIHELKPTNLIAVENIKNLITGFINDNAWVNDTWLSPYAGYEAKLIEYNNGKMELIVDGIVHKNMEGWFNAPNDWRYKIEQLISKE